MSHVTYRPCPCCNKSAVNACIACKVKDGVALFECPYCGKLYSTITARNGLLLEIRS